MVKYVLWTKFTVVSLQIFIYLSWISAAAIIYNALTLCIRIKTGLYIWSKMLCIEFTAKLTLESYIGVLFLVYLT